jgi:hypothetical protein
LRCGAQSGCCQPMVPATLLYTAFCSLACRTTAMRRTWAARFAAMSALVLSVAGARPLAEWKAQSPSPGVMPSERLQAAHMSARVTGRVFVVVAKGGGVEPVGFAAELLGDQLLRSHLISSWRRRRPAAGGRARRCASRTGTLTACGARPPRAAVPCRAAASDLSHAESDVTLDRLSGLQLDGCVHKPALAVWPCGYAVGGSEPLWF